MKSSINMLNALIPRVWILAGIFLLSFFYGSTVHATITFTKFMIAENLEAFSKGVEFPLVGLSTDKPTFVAARVYKWTQREDNMYVLQPTEDFSVYPQLLRMSPSSRRSITIKSTASLPSDKESFYRILLKEFDRADGADVRRDQESSELNVTIKPTISLPIVVRGPSTLKPEDLIVESIKTTNGESVNQGGEGGRRVTSSILLYNPGEVIGRIHAIGINAPPGKSNQFNGYILPGQRVAVPVDAKLGDEIRIAYSIGIDAKVNMNEEKKDDRKIMSVVVK